MRRMLFVLVLADVFLCGCSRPAKPFTPPVPAKRILPVAAVEIGQVIPLETLLRDWESTGTETSSGRTFHNFRRPIGAQGWQSVEVDEKDRVTCLTSVTRLHDASHPQFEQVVRSCRAAFGEPRNIDEFGRDSPYGLRRSATFCDGSTEWCAYVSELRTCDACGTLTVAYKRVESYHPSLPWERLERRAISKVGL